MGKVRHQAAGVDIVIREEFCGAATSRICYPGISTCAAITGVGPKGLIGTHITVGTDDELVSEIFAALIALGAAQCPVFCVTGALTQFKVLTQAPTLNTRKKIGKKIRAELSEKSVVRFFDTTKIGAVHIMAAKNGMDASFSWVKEVGNAVKGYTYPDFAGTPIPAADFVVR
ncbi:MAG TPA: hypothetical protein DEH78_02035 [Solibacterales bacterium]|nr:hypothetical protein [Bryobacterales bacterium]